ncbi:MAG: MBL fold metallo-hydrolase [Deltaproteobacteria bacterium]|jgi:glyoxylase-like metal-dependent hydrolase (beta-lactamase superfamily II)
MERRLYSVLGNSQKLDGGAMFGNAPRAMWANWAPPDELNRIDLFTRALLVREPSRNILFETGIGAFFEPKLKERFGVVEDEHVLLNSLEAAGLSHEDIDVVVLSHLHFDHAGGLLAAYEEGAPHRLLFPNAQFVVGAEAYARAKKPHARDRASFIDDLPQLLEDSGRLEIVEGTTSETLGDGYSFVISNGHTPGMILGRVEGEQGPVVFCGDLIPGVPWVRRAITMGYDRYPELLIDEKTTLLEEMLERGGRLFFTHDTHHALASLERDERNRIVPADLVESLDGLAA